MILLLFLWFNFSKFVAAEQVRKMKFNELHHNLTSFSPRVCLGTHYIKMWTISKIKSIDKKPLYFNVAEQPHNKPKTMQFENSKFKIFKLIEFTIAHRTEILLHRFHP